MRFVFYNYDIMNETYSDQEQEYEEVVLDAVEPERKKGQSTKGDADRRKQTSRENIRKAQQAKLAKLREQHQLAAQEQQYEYEEEETDSDSEMELTITKSKHAKSKPMPIPKRKTQSSAADKRLDALEKAIYQLAAAKQLKTKKATVIHNHVHTQPQKGAAKAPVQFDLFH